MPSGAYFLAPVRENPASADRGRQEARLLAVEQAILVVGIDLGELGTAVAQRWAAICDDASWPQRRGRPSRLQGAKFAMSTPTKTILPAVLVLSLVGLVPMAGQAKDGDDDDGDAIVPAAACQPMSATEATSSWSSKGGAFAVTSGSVALTCPLPTDELDSSSGGDPVTFKVAYFDGDAMGGSANVSVELVKTTASGKAPGFVEAENTCPAWRSSTVAANGPAASFTCPAGIVKGGHYNLHVTLTGAAGATPDAAPVAAVLVGVTANKQ